MRGNQTTWDLVLQPPAAYYGGIQLCAEELVYNFPFMLFNIDCDGIQRLTIDQMTDMTKYIETNNN